MGAGCDCLPDANEPDDSSAAAKALPMDGVRRLHTFHSSADQDWLVITGLVVGRSYNVHTSALQPGTDTELSLFSSSLDLIEINDDWNDNTECLLNVEFCASSVTWTATSSGPYYVKVRTLSYPASDFPTCYCPGYAISGSPLRNWAPIVLGPPMLPGATSTPTSTSTGATPTSSSTPTSTPTGPTPTSSSTPTSTRTATPTATGTATRTPTPSTPQAYPTLVPIPGAMAPNGLATDPLRQRLYVSSRDNDRLYVLETTGLGVLASLPVGSQPFGVAVNSTTNRIYVANYGSGDGQRV